MSRIALQPVFAGISVFDSTQRRLTAKTKSLREKRPSSLRAEYTLKGVYYSAKSTHSALRLSVRFPVTKVAKTNTPKTNPRPRRATQSAEKH